MQEKKNATMQATRSIERVLQIDAEPQQVWEAFTQAEHIENWFAPVAASTPGVGGTIDLKWDPNDEAPGQHLVITEWEPARRLVMSWRDLPDGEHPLPIEVTVEARDGGALFRLTHHGFLDDASWDDEFDSHGRGWTYELKSLKYYLEQQFGRSRQIVLERVPFSADYRDQWSRLVGPNGAFSVAEGMLDATECLVGLPTGQESRGRILNALTDKDFAVVLDALGGGVLRLTFETFAGEPEVWFWVSSWQLNEADLRLLARSWIDATRAVVAGH